MSISKVTLSPSILFELSDTDLLIFFIADMLEFSAAVTLIVVASLRPLFVFAVADPTLDYYLIVETREGYTHEPDPYIISTTFTQGIDSYETEVNDTAAEADTVISGDPITGVINDDGYHKNDYDWYVFDASAPGLLSVDLSGYTLKPVIYLNVYDGNSFVGVSIP